MRSSNHGNGVIAPDRLVTLGEARPGTVPPVMAWYPQGELRGHAFIYAER